MFTVVEGRMSPNYNHFKSYNLISVEATETRLMGVVAMKLSWKGKESDSEFYQVIHLDYSEFGVDDYSEFEIEKDENYEVSYNEMLTEWNNFVAVMGGKIVELPINVAIRLIDDAIDIWLSSELLVRGDENEFWRKGALGRVAMMKDTLIEEGVLTEGESESLDPQYCIELVSPKSLAAYETINYFLMRMVDRDIEAAHFLTTIDRETLKNSVLVCDDLQSLTRNTITSSKGISEEADVTYYCKYISMGYDSYYYGSLSIKLTGERGNKNRKVKDFDVGFHKSLSPFESAMLVKRSEYITVYDMADKIMPYFDITKIAMMRNATIKQVGNGWLFMQYNPDNSHVNKKEYYLNGDVTGAALMTVAGEFIVMSYQIMNISMIEASIASSSYGENMSLKGRYEVPNMAFQTLCDTPGLMFEEVIQGDDE